MKLFLVIFTLSILNVWYIDYQTNKIEEFVISQEELDNERLKFEKEMRYYDELINIHNVLKEID